MIRQRLLAGVLLLAGAVVGLWYGPSLVLKTHAVESWMATPAVVSSAHIEFDSSGSGVSRESDYTVVVHYRYQVGETEYLGNRYQVARALKLDQLSAAEAETSRYLANPEIEVFYDPENPSDSVMKQGGALHAWLTVVFGWAMLLSGAIVILRQRRGQKAGSEGI